MSTPAQNNEPSIGMIIAGVVAAVVLLSLVAYFAFDINVLEMVGLASPAAQAASQVTSQVVNVTQQVADKVADIVPAVVPTPAAPSTLDVPTDNNKMNTGITSKIISDCEGNYPTLTCPSGMVINSGTIKYGRWDNTICAHPTVNQNTKSIYKSYNISNDGLGKNSYSLGAINVAVGDDPYPNVYKHYIINYDCK